jgi:hypothetical protein
MNWNDYYMEQAGGGDYNTFKGSLYQRGYGLGGTFKRFFNWIVPLFKQNALPLIKQGATAVGKEALGTVANIAKDVVDGKPINESVQENANTAISNLKTKAEKVLTGKGIKRRRSKKKIIILKKSNKKRKIEDIFSNAD